MIPTELIYLLIAAGLGALIYRYATGRGGMEISRPALAGLPARGQVVVHQHEVRWSAADDDSFVAAWQLESGQLVAMQVTFDGADEEEPDLGRMELSIDRRPIARDIGWTEKIRDRTLRADVELVLKTLAREAKQARSDTARVASAKIVSGESGVSREGGVSGQGGVSAESGRLGRSEDGGAERGPS